MNEILIIGFLLAIGIGQFVLAVYLLGIKKKISPTSPPDQSRKTLNILRRAYERAKDIMVSAELSGIKIRSESKLEARRVTDEFARETKDQLALFLDSLKEQSKTEMMQFNKNFEKEMASVVDFELAELRKSLASYKAERMKELDSNIMSVTQRTVELVLSKKISLEDQADLVYESLEQAKKEKLIN